MKTLQEKIDAICPFHKEKNKVCEYCTVRENQNKAIQELREQIKRLPKYKGETSQGVDIAKVLALIGEKQ